MPNRISPEASDAFFNHPEAQETFADCVRVGLALAPAMLSAAKAVYRRGDIPARYSPEDYAADFIGRV